jgi:hypothetical protein
MSASAQPKSPLQESPTPLLGRVVRIAGVLILVGTVPLALLLPMGPRVIWSMVIAAVPLGFTLAGYYAWRRACPLAFFATLGQRLKVQRKRKVGDWLAAHGLEVQLGLLVAALAWRHLGANGTPWALAGLLVAVVVAATAVGFLYTGKTWCNHLCPVGVVEKFHQEPVLLLPAEDNSQCTACTACKKNCPDIDLEQGYWKELGSPARRRVYYLWPGLVLAFYCYFYLADGSWVPYFSGAWSRDTGLASRILSPGFFFAPAVPRLAAVPLTFLAFGLASFAAFSLLERFLLARSADEQARATIRHHCLALAGFGGFVLFYAFTIPAALAALPAWFHQVLAVGIVMVATALLLARWSRSEATFIQEKFARGLLKRWEWGDAPPSNHLSDIYLLHQERSQQREARLKTYKATVRDLLAEGVLNRGNLILLQKLRAELGIADKDHDKLLSELSLEEKRLFDPAYQGSMEKQLQLDQYRGELEALLLGNQRPEPAAVESLRQVHRIRPEEHAAIMDQLRGEQGPLVARLQEPVRLVLDLHMAALAADRVEALEVANGRAGLAHRRRVAFYRHVVQWKQRQHLNHILQLLELGFQEPRLQDLRLTLTASGTGGIQDVLTLLGALVDQGPLGAVLAPLASLPTSIEDPGPALRRTAASEARFLRAAALTLLGYLGDAASDQVLRGGLMDPDPLVRETAQTLLGMSGELDATLSELAEDEEQWLLRAAVQSLPGKASEERAGQATLRHKGKGAELGAEFREAPLAVLELLMFLHGMPLFAQLEPDDLETLAASCRERRFGPDESLCRQGERSDEVFLILRGRVRTWVLDAEGEPRSLGDSGEGTCIGEMAVLDPAPRAATVTALRDVLTLVLGGRVFRDVLHDRPAVAEGVLKVLTQRLRAMIQGS